MNLKGKTPLELLNKSRDERSDLLRSACQIFTLEQDSPNNKQEIEALLRSKMGEIAGESTRELDLSTANEKRPLSTTQEPIGTSSLNIAADLPAKIQQIVRPPKNPTPRVTQMKRSSGHTANSIKPSAQSAPDTSLGAHSSSKEKSNMVIQKKQCYFLNEILSLSSHKVCTCSHGFKYSGPWFDRGRFFNWRRSDSVLWCFVAYLSRIICRRKLQGGLPNR